MTTSELQSLTAALELMSSSSAVEKERQELKELQEDQQRAQAYIESMGLSNTLDVQRMSALVKKLETEIERYSLRTICPSKVPLTFS